MKKLYDWVLSWAKNPYAVWILFGLAFVESSFFPIPPDVLLMALCISIPLRAWRFALVCTLGSVMGGMFGYAIGFFAFDSIGQPVLEFYGAMDKYDWLSDLYKKYDAWIVFSAGFTPIPYKVFTIGAGVFHVNFVVFVLASLLGRALRFYLIATLLKKYGVQIKSLIERYFGWFSYGFVALLLLGFFVLKFVL